MKLASRPPLRRLVLLDEMLRNCRYPNAQSAARKLEVNPKTVRRDLAFLRDSWGAPLAFHRERNGFYYTESDFSLPMLRLTEGELVALFLAERLMQQYRGSPFAKDLASAFQKLTAALPDEVTVDLAHLSEAFSHRPTAVRAADAKRLRELTRAVRERRQLELVYWTAYRDDVCRRVVDPYHMVSVEGEWYLVCYCHLREEVRMFLPSRVRSIRETGQQFERPADFRISDYLDGAFRVIRGQGGPVRVRLRFSPEAARYVREKKWHPSQRIEKSCRDGSLILSLRVNHLLEVRRWVLSWGARCRVLEPVELRRDIVADAVQLSNSYSVTS